MRATGTVVSYREIRDGDDCAIARACASRPLTGDIVTVEGQLATARSASRSARRCRWSTRLSNPQKARIALFVDNWLGASVARGVGLLALGGGFLVRRSVRRSWQSAHEHELRQAYYRRFYFDSRTAVISRAEMRARAKLIGAYAESHRPAGAPHARRGLRHRPAARAAARARFRAREYTGLEYSEYLCKRYGWTQGSLADCRADPFDLVVCYDVLQYLDDHTAARAIANLGRLTRGVLYLSALTARDWRENCDRTRTDREVHLRDGAVVRHAPAPPFPSERRGVLDAARRATHHLGNGNRR